MTPREALLEALIVERFQGGWLTKDADDSSRADTIVNIARRRRELLKATMSTEAIAAIEATEHKRNTA
jgi:hypothetical protein